MRTITHIVVHTAAAGSKGVAIDQEPENVLSYWQRKGWKKPGYHEYVRFDGRVHKFADDDVETNGVLGLNDRAWHICGSGHGDIQDFTGPQKLVIVQRIAAKLKQFGLVETFKKNPMRVLGHRETGPLVLPIYRTRKTCPGTKVDMKVIRQMVLAELNSLPRV